MKVTIELTERQAELTQIAAAMLQYAREHKYDPVGSPVPFQQQLGHGLRLTCYVLDDKFVLDMERRYRDLEKGESYITRLAFHAPRSAKAVSIPAHDGWRGVRLTWDAKAKANADAERKPEQVNLF